MFRQSCKATKDLEKSSQPDFETSQNERLNADIPSLEKPVGFERCQQGVSKCHAHWKSFSEKELVTI